MSRQAWNACISVCLFTVVVSCPIDVRAQSIPPEIPTDGLVGWWPFNGNADDESGAGNHGAVYGATLTEDRFGNPNSAYYFALFDYITTPFLGVGGSSERTIAFWMKNRYGGRTLTPTRYGGGNSNYGDAFLTGMNRNHQHDQCNCWPTVYEGMGVEGGHLHLLYGTDIGDSTNWHHYVWVVPPSAVNFRDVKMYRDGVLVSNVADIVFDYNGNSTTLALNTNLTANEPFIIGKSHVVPTSPAGSQEDMGPSEYVDDVAFWDRALSEQEIASIYEGVTSISMRSDTIALGSYGSSTKIVGPSSGSYQYALPSVSGTLATTQTDPLPYGTVIMYASATPPAGYLECNGQIVSRSTYAGLFAVVGTSYGAGNGSTTFAVPTLTHPVLRYGIRAQ